MKPKISIITVSYNSAAHIEEAIQSVVNQQYDNKEYIIIDGGSTDGTLDIIAKYRDKIDYFVSEPDKGISDAFNKGISAATGDIIGICNSDDVLHHDIMSNIALNYDEDIDIYRTNEITKNFETGEEWISKPTLIYNKKLIGCHACHMGCFISKKAYIKYGMYDINLRSSMDTDLLRRFTIKGAKYKYIPVVCGYFRKGGVSENAALRNKERNIVIKRYGGTQWDVFISMCYNKSYQTIKRFLNLLGKDTATKMRTLINK